MKQIPEKASVDGIEAPLVAKWEADGLYHYDSESSAPVYSIDTPPPTVSGSLHVGHVFSYTHTDLIARYKRMRGYNIFYPMGFDDNGLPTERRVQNYYGVRPDLTKPYQPNYQPPFQGTDGKPVKPADQQPISRQNFIELCQELATQDEVKFKELWQQLGISVDWRQTYQTIDQRSRRIAQKFFLRNLSRGQAYQSQAPGLWDVTFQTAVAQAEVEAREYPGHYHRIAFRVPVEGGAAETQNSNWGSVQGGDFPPTNNIYIETTRPELLISCVALIAHPDDQRYQHLFGQTAYSPLFDVQVPILAHTGAQMDKGAGIAMCCTFGDLSDVDWWRDLELPLRSCVNKAGRLATDDVDWVTSARGLELAQELAGKTVFSARELVVERLKASGELDGEPKATMRMASFYEKGDKPLEIVTSRQWYITNGGKKSDTKSDGEADLNAQLLQRGDQLRFVPDFMRVRYANWVGGLNNDWLISRQRFFGVAFPLWYPLNADGEIDYSHPILPDESVLPVDPVTDVPAGYSEAQRGRPSGFVAEVDIMDTWATSSLTPQIACNWEEPESDFDKLFPMSLRPQGQDIIRTWLFSTVVRSHLEHGQLPWEVAAISGWILDPDRKKMSKSKGNVVTPLHLLEQFGSDAVRYWASAAKLGVDATFDEGKMKIGRRLAMKVLNVTKFVLGITTSQVEAYDNYSVANLLDFDQALLAQLNLVVTGATSAFENYDHARALELTETFFWEFCDDYVELVKRRAYNQPDESGKVTYSDTEMNSARTTLILTLRTLLNLLAPFLPFATEEAWSWFNDSSIHRTTWATEIVAEITGDNTGVAVEQAEIWSVTTEVLEVLRRVKSERKVSMKTALSDVVVTVPEAKLQLVQPALADLRATLNIVGNFEVVPGEAVAVVEAQVVE